jgi:hypothetical protein
MSKTARERILREDLNWWSRETGYTVEILKAAIRRGDLRAERPSGFERGRLYVSSDEMERWLRRSYGGTSGCRART